MRFSFTPEQLEMQSALRALLARECPAAKVRSAWSSDGGTSLDLWSVLADFGLVGLTIPQAHGGLGLDELDLVLLLEECGRVALPAPIVETTAVAAPLLRESASDALRDRWLSPIARGDAIVSVGLASSPFVLDAHLADLVLLERGDEVHAVPRAALSLVPQPSIDRSRRLFRVDWEPTSATCIARGALAANAVGAAYDRGALAVSAQLLGLARQMIDLTVEHVKLRQQFGRAIGAFQAVKHHLADALVGLEFARPLVYRAAYSVARGDADRAVHVSMAKAQSSEAAERASRVALQCHGAIGYSYEHDLHLWMKRAWALGASWGTAEVHRARVGEKIFSSASGEGVSS